MTGALVLSDPPKPPGQPPNEPDPDAPVPVEEPPAPIPVPRPDPPPEPLRACPVRYARFTFQNTGPLHSSLPCRLVRYAVGIWNWPSVTVGTCW
jgi:hypothetical protein